MIHTKQKKYLDKVAQWLCDDTHYYVNLIHDGSGAEMVLYFPFINDEKYVSSGFYFTILDELLNWNVSYPQEFSFANLFSLYVRDTYGVLGDEVNHLWDVYRNKLKRQWVV